MAKLNQVKKTPDITDADIEADINAVEKPKATKEPQNEETTEEHKKRVLTLNPKQKKVKIPDGIYEVTYANGWKDRYNALIGETFMRKLQRGHPQIKDVKKIL